MMRQLSLFILLLVHKCNGNNLHRHGHGGYSKNQMPSEIVKGVLDGLKPLLPVQTGGNAEYRVLEHGGYNELAVAQECSVTKYCGAGRMCIVSQEGQEMCVCAKPGSCAPGNRLVCGSDGNLYDSHCELHRRSCENQQKIYVDRGGSACFQKDLLTKTSMSKKKDLSLAASTFKTKARVTTTHATTAVDVVQEKYDESCSYVQYGEFKHLLKIYHCNRLGIAKCDNLDNSKKKSLVSKVFDYYDRDGNGLVTLDELMYTQSADHLEKLAHICSLRDLIVYSPHAEGTDFIDLLTFYNEFEVDRDDVGEKLILHSGETKLIYATADGYTGVEIACELTHVSDIVWMRNGFDIEFQNTNSFSILSNRDLFISAVNLDHTGNYTCYDASNQHVFMTQILVVLVKPVVRSNKVGHVLEGTSVSLRCHLDGVPQPTAEWQVGQYEVPQEMHRYQWDNENTTLTILSPQSDLDSADYVCVGKSAAGWMRSTTNVGVLPKDLYLQDADLPSKGLYLVFHDSGYTTYEAEHCYTSHSINKYASDFKGNLKESDSTLERLCSYEEDCEWGVAVNVENKYIYVSQPDLHRIVVIDILDNFRPKYVILFKYKVSSLHYVSKTDELWILVGNQYQFQTVMILNDASEGPYMQLVPLLPHHSVFDSVDQLFIPHLTEFNTTSRYAFSSHYDQHGLSRLDTATLMYNGLLDLSEWNCKPTALHYLAIGGLALVECDEESSGTNLLIDTVTNKMSSEFEGGELHVSPNTRYIVVVQKPNKISLYYLNDNATISQMYTHVVHIPVNQVRFMESEHSAGYDLAITSPDGDSLLFFDIKTKKTDVIKGMLSGKGDMSHNLPKESVPRLVASSGSFGEDIMIPASGTLFIVNKQHHMIACEWANVNKYQAAMWIDI